jgi:hypothetical protein
MAVSGLPSTVLGVVTAISGAAVALALLGVMTAAVLISTLSFSFLWPVLVGCGGVAVAGAIVCLLIKHLGAENLEWKNEKSGESPREPKLSFPQSSYPKSSFPKSSFPQSSFSQSSSSQSSFPKSSFPKFPSPQSSAPAAPKAEPCKAELLCRMVKDFINTLAKMDDNRKIEAAMDELARKSGTRLSPENRETIPIIVAKVAHCQVDSNLASTLGDLRRGNCVDRHDEFSFNLENGALPILAALLNPIPHLEFSLGQDDEDGKGSIIFAPESGLCIFFHAHNFNSIYCYSFHSNRVMSNLARTGKTQWKPGDVFIVHGNEGNYRNWTSVNCRNWPSVNFLPNADGICPADRIGWT